MTLALESFSSVGIHCEWERIEVLAQCLAASRSGKEPETELIARLRRLQHQVEVLRRGENSPWLRLSTEDLSFLGLDVLACIFATEAKPAVAWHYQELQPGNNQPYVTSAFLQILLALDDQEVRALQALAGVHGELERRNLIEVEGEGAFAPLRPARGAVAKLMGWPETMLTPPGATRVKEQAFWNELVLPPDREIMLREYLLWLKHRHIVVHEWGGKTVGGPVALFSGPSGTGKTFAACVMATELGWPLFRVDLARLVSKYIGETEKNLGRLFDAAHGRKMILQFDEVDALMSKRGEIKEARDRYANMEVSYLLARIEDHDGPCILTTNLRNQIDKAFSRRFQMVVEFPRPDEAARARLWALMIPPRAPLGEGVELDLLARSVNLTGGNIKNAALHAAYLAAEDGHCISMGHIATAVYRELAKDRPQLSRNELGPLAAHLPSFVQCSGERP